MKAMLIGILALGTSSAFAQNLTKDQFAKLLHSKKAQLEAVNVGMSKSTVTTSSVTLDDGTKCDYTQTALQSILRIDGDKMIILSKESFQPVANDVCTAAGIQAFQENVLFYEDKPSVDEDIKDLNESDVKSIVKAGDQVTMMVNGTLTNDDGTTTIELVTVKYDLTKSSFKNLILNQTPSVKVETTDAIDLDLTTVDLHDVVFCENNDADNSDCVRGDFSDILF
jgi:hypothetical protein